MQSHIPGELVAVRGSIWRLRSQNVHTDCTELELESLEPGRPASWTADLPFGCADPCRILLEPFDRPEPLVRPSTSAVVTRRTWMVALLDAISRERRYDLLSAPVAAAIDILPFQLEPALAMTVRGVPRVLLADAVGLGKTIQAALVVAELLARHAMRRALVLTPSGLRDQWAGELRDRFGLEPTVADAAWLRSACTDLPTSINPWSVGNLIITSIDFVKRPDVLRGLDRLNWDIVVVDEAHAASTDSLRREAAHSLARRARRVLLLTATPHSGDRSDFDALCRIGAAATDEPIVLFRRSRADAGFHVSRRVHLLPVRRTDAERELHCHLLMYVRRIWSERGGDNAAGARLAAMVLLKRAFSSITSLVESLEFRLAHLADPVAALVAQLDLPLDDEALAFDEAPLVALVAPGLDDESEERRVLTSLVTLARAAVAADSKARILARILRRVSEPCIVFTEYRDTLEAIERHLPAAVTRTMLHGGLDRAARAHAIREFTSGRSRVLLATDAGGEGLNLQATCRVVINFELPWNPIRLEQRIGRVDRIGQRRTVHAVNLVAAGTHEASLLARLARRLESVRDALGQTDEVLGQGSDMAIAGIMAGAPDAAAPWSDEPVQSLAPPPSHVERMSLGEEAQRQRTHVNERRAVRAALSRRRPLGTRGRGSSVGRSASTRVAAVSVGRMRSRSAQSGVLAVYRVTTVDRTGRLVDAALVPLFAPVSLRPLHRRSDVAAMVREWLLTFRSPLDALALRLATERLDRIGNEHQQAAAVGVSRSRAQRLVPIGEELMIQSGLFDRRAERDAEQRQWEQAAEDPPLAVPTSAGGARDDIALAEPPVLQLILMVTP